MRKSLIVLLLVALTISGCFMTPAEFKLAPDTNTKIISSSLTYQEAYRRAKTYLKDKYETHYTQLNVEGDLYTDTKMGAIKTSYKAAGMCVMLVEIAERPWVAGSTITIYTRQPGFLIDAEAMATTLFNESSELYFACIASNLILPAAPSARSSQNLSHQAPIGFGGRSFS